MTCTTCTTTKTRYKGTFFMVKHDTRILRLGYHKHEKIRKKGSNIDMLNTRKG